MLDHLAGRPSPGWQRIQILLTILAGTQALKLDKIPLQRLSRLNTFLSKFPPWKIITTTLLVTYVCRNFFLLTFLNAPEPLARMYTHSFYRVTWILTSLDAGFLTAMNIRPKWLRDILSLAFSFLYLFDSEAADEKVRKYRACTTIDMLRISWEKTLNPYIRLVTYFDRGYLAVRDNIFIPRPEIESPTSFPNVPKGKIAARLYCSVPMIQCRTVDKLVFQVPGGGFVTMPPEAHDDYTSGWARSLSGIPIISINYGKAPEHPYPWAIEEVFDAYRSIVESNGEVLGLTGWYFKDAYGKQLGPKRDPIKIIFAGDSA
jgi:hypothetical protein